MSDIRSEADYRHEGGSRVSRREPFTLRSVGTVVLDRVTEWDDAARQRWPFKTSEPEELILPVGGADPRILIRPAVIGFLAILAIAVGVAQQSSPFVLKMTGAWFYGVASPGQAPSKHGYFLGLVAVYGGLVLLMRVWYRLGKMLSKFPGIPVRYMAAMFGLWTVPLLVAPPLFSRDVYSYAAQGEMVSHHISPYMYGPGTLGANSYVSLVDKLWINAPAPYGPVFEKLGGVLASISFHHELVTVIMLRLVALAGVVLLAIGIPKLARQFGRDPSEAFALAVLNPVTMLHLVGGAHNDGLMAGLLVLGLVAAKNGRPVVGIVLCALATAVKAPAIVGVIYIGWEWLGTCIPVRQRIRPVVTAGIIGAVVLAVCSTVSGLGWGWVSNLTSNGAAISWLSPSTGLGIFISHLGHLIGLDIPRSGALAVTRGIGEVVAAITCVWLLLRSDRIGMLRAMGLTLLAVTLLGPVVQPWYLAWGLVLLAPIATGKVRSVLIVLSVTSGFIGLPGGRELLANLVHTNPVTMMIAVGACLSLMLVPLTPSKGIGSHRVAGSDGRDLVEYLVPQNIN